jgi:hypothetical protein
MGILDEPHPSGVTRGRWLLRMCDVYAAKARVTPQVLFGIALQKIHQSHQ